MNSPTNGFLLRLPLLLDSAMLIALASLSYWIGLEASKIDNVNIEVHAVQQQVTTLTTSTTANLNAQVVALQVRADGQDKLTQEWRSDLVQRLDRIERKLDRVK